MTNILLLSALLTDPDRTSDQLDDWETEIDELRREAPSVSTTMHALHILAHTVWELRRWDALTERHRAAMTGLGVRLYYILTVMMTLALAVAGFWHGEFTWLAALLVVLTPWPLMTSAWPSDAVVLDLPPVRKNLQLVMTYVGLLGMVGLLIVGPWLLKIGVLLVLGFIAHALFAGRVSAWRERLTWRD